MARFTPKVLRVAHVYYGKVIQDQTFKKNKREVVIGVGKKVDVLARVLGIRQNHRLLVKEGNEYVLQLTDRIPGGKFHIQGKTYDLPTLLAQEGLVQKRGEIEVFDEDRKLQKATLYAIPLNETDWGIIDFGGSKLVFQFVLPKNIIEKVAAFGRAGGPIAEGTRALTSILGFGLLISIIIQFGIFFYASITYNPEAELEAYNEEADRILAYHSEDQEKQLEEEEEIIEEETEIETAIEDEEPPKAAEGEEGKFGDEDLDNETQLANIDGPLAKTIDKPVGLQEAIGSALMGTEGGASSLFGSGDMFTTEDQAFVGMNGEGDAFKMGFGHGGMGMAGMGSGGGGGPGGGVIGGIGKGSGHGRGRGGRPRAKKAKAKVKPKLKLAAPKSGKFCKPSDISKAVGKKAGRLRNCYERRLLADPTLSGKIIMQWKIQLDGSAKGVRVKSSTIKDPQVGRCLERVISRIKFTKPDGGICVIEYPFTFVSQ